MKTLKIIQILLLTMLSLSGSLIAQSMLTLDLGGGFGQAQNEAYVNKSTTYGGRLYVPITRKGWDGTIKKGISLGILATYSVVNPHASADGVAPKGLNIGGTGVTTNTLRGWPPGKPGWKNGIGFQVNWHAGSIVASPFITVGQDKQGANGTEVVQEVTFNGKTDRYVLSSASRPETKVLAITPGLRIGYRFSKFIGLWASGQYTTGGEMVTNYTQYIPNGSPDQNGNYTIMQVQQGQVRPAESTVTPYKNLGFSGGLSFSFGGRPRPRPRYGVMVDLIPECCIVMVGATPPKPVKTGEVKFKMTGVARSGVEVKVVSAGITTFETYRPGFYLGCYPVPVSFELVRAISHLPLEEGGAVNGVAKYVYSSKACSIEEKPADPGSGLAEATPASPRTWGGSLDEIFDFPPPFFVVRKNDGLEGLVNKINKGGKGRASITNSKGKKYIRVESGTEQNTTIEMYPVDEAQPSSIIIVGAGAGCKNAGCKSCGIPTGGTSDDCACLSPISSPDHPLQDCRVTIARPLSDLIATPTLTDLNIIANADGSLSQGSINNITDLVVAQIPGAKVKGPKIVTEKKGSYLLIPVVRGKESFTLVSTVERKGARQAISNGIWSVMMYCEGGTCGTGTNCFSVAPAYESGVISCPCGPRPTNPCKPTFGKMVGWQKD